MSENSSEVHKLCAPFFLSHPMQKKKLDQKDGAFEARLALYMTETRNMSLLETKFQKICSRERLAAANVISYCILVHPCKALALCSVVYLSCEAVVFV